MTISYPASLAPLNRVWGAKDAGKPGSLTLPHLCPELATLRGNLSLPFVNHKIGECVPS